MNGFYELYRLLFSLFFLLRYRCFNVDLTSKIERPIFISKDFVLGKYSFINKNAFIYEGVICGDYVMFGPNVIIAGTDHAFDVVGTPMYFSGRNKSLVTNIGSDVWVGANSCIKSGVTIGSGSIIGMGSVVTKDVPKNSIVAGNPAKVIRSRFDAETFKCHLNSIGNCEFVRSYCR